MDPRRPDDRAGLLRRWQEAGAICAALSAAPGSSVEQGVVPCRRELPLARGDLGGTFGGGAGVLGGARIAGPALCAAAGYDEPVLCQREEGGGARRTPRGRRLPPYFARAYFPPVWGGIGGEQATPLGSNALTVCRPPTESRWETRWKRTSPTSMTGTRQRQSSTSRGPRPMLRLRRTWPSVSRRGWRLLSARPTSSSTLTQR